jgi:hypothetical protein
MRMHRHESFHQNGRAWGAGSAQARPQYLRINGLVSRAVRGNCVEAAARPLRNLSLHAARESEKMGGEGRAAQDWGNVERRRGGCQTERERGRGA